MRSSPRNDSRKLPRLRFVPANGGFIPPRKPSYTGPPWNPHLPIFGITIESHLPCNTQ